MHLALMFHLQYQVYGKSTIVAYPHIAEHGPLIHCLQH